MVEPQNTVSRVPMSDAPDKIAYGRLMHHAMRGLLPTVLSDVGRDGLPGEHHFFITFDTRHDGVDLAPWLRERYPDEMTIVIQSPLEDYKKFIANTFRPLGVR